MARCPAPEPAQLLPKPRSWKEMRVKLGMAAEKRCEVVSPCSQMCWVPRGQGWGGGCVQEKGAHAVEAVVLGVI